MQLAVGYFTGAGGLMRASAFGTYYLITNFLLPSTPSTSSQLGAPAPDYISTWCFAVILDRASVLGEREGKHTVAQGHSVFLVLSKLSPVPGVAPPQRLLSS